MRPERVKIKIVKFNEYVDNVLKKEQPMLGKVIRAVVRWFRKKKEVCPTCTCGKRK